MDGMSDIRNEIEQRLGVFARQGAKAAFATEVGRKGNKVAKISRDPDGGWKAWVVQRGSTGIDEFEDVLGNIRSYSTEEKAKRAVIAALETSGFSRPGAKAAFAADAGAVAKEILRQLGGGRFMSMVGGKNAFHGNFGGKPGLQVDIGKGAQGGINRLIVTLDPASDTYNMEFWRIAKGGLSTKKVSEASGVYADDLQRVFTDRTKFYTSMSRPGAKVEFAITKEQIRGASREELRSIEQRLTALAKSGDKNAAALLDYVEQEYNDRYRGTHSRPGAKATAAKAEFAYKVGDRVHGGFGVAGGAGVVGTITKIEDGYAYIKGDSEGRFGPQIYKVSIQKVTDPPKKAWESAKPNDKTECADCETEQDKAGLKLMEKADKAVSDKIRTLIKEGKPQDQAVAIALDMKRRGEL